MAPEAPWLVAEALSQAPGGERPRLLHLLGSAGGDPGRPRPDLDRERARFPEVECQPVILGFREEDDRSRWLTDDEIVHGVVRAIREPAPRTVIGTVESRSARP